MRLICFLKGIWRTITNLYPYSGHNFIEIYDNKDIQILKCKVCGYVSVGFKIDGKIVSELEGVDNENK